MSGHAARKKENHREQETTGTEASKCINTSRQLKLPRCRDQLKWLSNKNKRERERHTNRLERSEQINFQVDTSWATGSTAHTLFFYFLFFFIFTFCLSLGCTLLTVDWDEATFTRPRRMDSSHLISSHHQKFRLHFFLSPLFSANFVILYLRSIWTGQVLV